MERQKKILVVAVCVPLLALAAWRIVPFLLEQGITDRWDSKDAPPPPKRGDGTAPETSSAAPR